MYGWESWTIKKTEQIGRASCRERVETVSDFIFMGSKITADGDCSHEIKRRLPLRRKVMTNLDSIFKSRDITLSTKVHLVKAMVFSSGHVWMRELDYKESWVPKNWCFWTVVLEKTLESPLDFKEIQPVQSKGDQSWVFIGRTDVEAETPILGHLMRRADSLEKALMLGKIEGRRRRGQQRMRWLDSMDMGLGGLRELLMDREAWHAVVHGVTKSRTRLSDWTELNWILIYIVALFIIAKTWKQQKRPMTDEWIKKMSIYIQQNITMEYYSAIQRNKMSHLEKCWWT